MSQTFLDLIRANKTKTEATINNAKLALEEVFRPHIARMLEQKLQEQWEHPPYRLAVGKNVVSSLWEQHINGNPYTYNTYNSESELTQAITDEIDREILNKLMTETMLEKGYIYAPSQKLDYMWDESLAARLDPTYIVAPVRITPSVEITPDEMKSDLWQQITNPILTKLRLLLPPQLVAQKSWDTPVKTSSLPDTSTLRISPSTYRRLLPSKTLKKALPTEKDNTTFPLVPELNWYSIEEYPNPLTYGSILTNTLDGVTL